MSITGLYASLIGLLFVATSIAVIGVRRSAGVSLGDGGDKLLQRRIRGQANLAEYAPIALILMLVLESGGAHPYLVHGLGIVLVLGRAMHAFAFSSLTPRPICRTGGMVLTFAVIIVAAARGLLLAAGVS